MLSDRIVTQAGFRIVIRSGSVSKLVQQAVSDGLKEVAQNYKVQVVKNISLDDHTLEELRQMGHPYAANKAPGSLHGDDRMVHTQSGEFLKSIRVSQPERTTEKRFTVYVTSDDPILPFLLYGTSRMRPRRFHEKAYEQIKDKFWNPVISRLKKLDYRIETSAKKVRLG